MSIKEIKRDFSKVYFEDPLIAIKFIFYVGDVRGGLGERKVFNSCIDWLIENKPDIAISVIEFIPEYTRWDNLARLAVSTNGDIHSEVISIIKNQLIDDLYNMEAEKNISLCAKWLPSINASSKETRLIAENICLSLGFTPRRYRKTLSTLRKYLDVVEVKMSAKEWGEINYSTVPSQANLKYSDAFLRNDEDRRRKYLESLKKGETKINASVAQPHEIVSKYNDGSWYYRLNEYNTTLEEMLEAEKDDEITELQEEDTYERYNGSYAQDEMGYSDDDIDTIFDGNPSAYWNID